MSAEKVFLTYKRKRKRLSKSGRPADYPLIVTVKHNDSSGKCVSEDHERDSAVPEDYSASEQVGISTRLKDSHCVEASDIGGILLSSHELSSSPDLFSEEKLDSIEMGSCFYISTSSPCNDVQNDGNFDSKTCYEKDMPPKLASALLTYSRIQKRKKNVDGTDTQNKSLVSGDNELATKRENSPHESTTHKCFTEDNTMDLNLPEEDPDITFLLDQPQDKMKDVTPICIVATTSEPIDVGYIDQPIVEGTIPNIALSNDKTVHVHSSNDVQKDSCTNCFETSSHSELEDPLGRCITGDNDIVALKLELHTGGEAQIMSSDGVKPIVLHENMSGEEKNLVDFDSSVVPSDSCDMVDLNIMPDSCYEEKLIHATSETFWGSSESTCKKSETLQLLGTMDNKLDETLSSVNHTQAYRNACTFGEVGFICNCSEKASPSPVFSMHTTSMSKCLPLFSENKTREVFPLASSTNQQAMGSSGKINFLSELKQNQQRHESLQRHKMMLDSIQNRPRTLNQIRGQFLYNSKACTGIWSEDELDYLWIGVRRHGKENWDALLRDPRLHFSPWRTSKQLSERWDEEQSMILGGAHTSHVREVFTKEYTQKNWINVPHGPVRVQRYHKKGGNTVHFSDSDGSRYKFGLLNQSNTDMPHWLKEAVIVPSPTTRLTEHMPKFSMSGDPESSKFVTGETSRTRCHVEKVDNAIEINSEMSSEEMTPSAGQL